MQSILAIMQGQGEAIPWDDVRLFLALCRSRTLGEAGRHLGVDASTISRRLAALEQALNATLFERGRDGIAATEAAHQLQPVAEEMEHVMARFSGAVEAFEREVEGLVRIACPGDAAQILIAPLLPKLLRRHPRLQVEIVAGEQVVDLARREADLALRTMRPTMGDLVVTRLLTVDWRLAVSKGVARKVGPLRSWGDVRWVSCGARLANTTPGRWFERHLAGVEPVVFAESLAVQLSCVAAGVGAALLPSASIKPSGLTPLALHESLREGIDWPSDDFLMVTPRSMRRVPRIAAVWDFLLEEAPRLA